MPAIDKRKFGRVDLEVTDMGFGTAPIGNFLRPIARMCPTRWCNAPGTTACATSIRHPITVTVFRKHGSGTRCAGSPATSSSVVKGGPRAEARGTGKISFAPWVDALPNVCHFDYSYDGTMRSFEDSLQRLGLEHIDILFIHDADVFTHGAEQQKIYFRQAMEGCYPALLKLKEQGAVKAIGVGVNNWDVMLDFMKAGDFDCLLMAGRYTLLEQEPLDELLPLCEKRGAAIVIGGGLNSGILATGAVPGAKYNYAPAPEHIMERVRKIEAVCKAHGVPLPAAALQFLLAHPAVASHVPGTRTVEQMDQNVAWMSHPIPLAFWQELKHKGLLRQDAPVPA